jgi:lipid-A-disaccharide synthase
MDKPVVKELIQHDLTEENLLTELTLLLKDKAVRDRIKADYTALWTKLGEKDASRRAAAVSYAEAKK